ncbi:hypothetical protein GQ44DRAFT_756209 [Phaeosphaeriaceae sp. PMI808]|nr:hypothetical protein GQ44DRAFT_756209 [Phaeosphaeriaceae sp. PMI808]
MESPNRISLVHVPLTCPPKPKKSNPNRGIAPLHTLFVYNLYKRYEPQTQHKPWEFGRGLDIGTDFQTSQVDGNGIVINRRLRSHGMQEIRGQREDVFPKCLSKERVAWITKKLHPQYGELADAMHQQNKFYASDHLQQQRAVLKAAKGKGWEAIQLPTIPLGSACAECETKGQLIEPPAASAKKQLRLIEELRIGAKGVKQRLKKKHSRPVEKESISHLA